MESARIFEPTPSQKLIRRYFPALVYHTETKAGIEEKAKELQNMRLFTRIDGSPKPETFASLSHFLCRLWKMVSRHRMAAERERDCYATAIAMDMFYTAHYRPMELDSDTLDTILDAMDFLDGASEELRTGVKPKRGPPEIPRVKGYECRCGYGKPGEWDDPCECDFDLPCDCPGGECVEICKRDKRREAFDLLADERIANFSTAPPEERNIACYCEGIPILLVPPKGEDGKPKEGYDSVRVDYGDDSFECWFEEMPNAIAYDGNEENYTGRFLQETSDPSIHGKLIEAGIREPDEEDEEGVKPSTL